MTDMMMMMIMMMMMMMMMILSGFIDTRIFCSFSRSPQIPNIMKIHPVEVKLFHEDRRTDGQAWQSK
jgi:hypothetical protein